MKTKLVVTLGGEDELEVSNAYELHPLCNTSKVLESIENAVTLQNAMAKLREIAKS